MDVERNEFRKQSERIKRSRLPSPLEENGLFCPWSCPIAPLHTGVQVHPSAVEICIVLTENFRAVTMPTSS